MLREHPGWTIGGGLVLTGGLLEAGKQTVRGIGDGIRNGAQRAMHGIYSAVRHPLATTESIYGNLKSPIARLI